MMGEDVSTEETARKAIRRLRNANTELLRAIASADPERLNKAGTSYAVAKIKLFALVAPPRSLPSNGDGK